MSIASEITRLQNAKADIKAAIEGAGVTVSDEFTLDQYAECIDNISIPSGTISITANGTYDVADYETANVNVSGGSSTLGTKTITANGTYNASDDSLDGYSSVTVNVSGGGGSGVITTTLISNSSGDVCFSDALDAAVTAGYTLTYDDCFLIFRAMGTNYNSDPPTNYSFNNHHIIVKDGAVWNTNYNRCQYASATSTPDSFAPFYLSNAISGSNIIDSDKKITNPYSGSFQAMGGSGTTITLFEIPMDWTLWYSTL